MAKGWAVWLHYGLGLSFVKSSALLARLGIKVSPGALCQAAQSASSDLVPVQAAIVEKVNGGGPRPVSQHEEQTAHRTCRARSLDGRIP